MQLLTSIPFAELAGKRVIVRAGLDVPIDATGEVSDMFRVKQSCETLEYLTTHGARVIVLSHIGRDPHTTNAAVARAISKYLPVVYIPDLVGPAAQQASQVLKDGEIILLENLRTDEREEKNDEVFARALSQLADIYVDDAFSVAHRAHASIVGIPKHLPHYAGLLMQREVETLTRALTPTSPSLALVGGAKFETKEPLITKLLAVYDHVFVAGALANDLFKAHGFPVGTSLISDMTPPMEIVNHPHILIPTDVTVEDTAGQARVTIPLDVLDTDKLVDIGPDTVALLAPLIQNASTILWNGPTGIYEYGYTHYTHALAEQINSSRAHAIIGGGDTVAAIQEPGVPVGENVFLSTGGGAMLEFLMQGTLPGIQALD